MHAVRSSEKRHQRTEFKRIKRTLKQFSAIATKVQKRQNRVLLMTRLESDLNEAIQTEDFELCASIREQIKQYNFKR